MPKLPPESARTQRKPTVPPPQPPKVRQKPGPKPFQFVEAVILEICERLVDGESLRTILGPEKAPHLPAMGVFYAAVVQNKPEGISERYARAREAQAFRWAEEIREISDDASHDTIQDEKGNPRQNHEWIARSRLRVDTRKWLLSKLLPKTFGEKVDVTSGGEKMAAPIAMLPQEMMLPKGRE